MKNYIYLFFLSISLVTLNSCDSGGSSSSNNSGGGSAQKRSLYVAGDSWADIMDDSLVQAELGERNLSSRVTVHKHGVGGSTARGWASDSGGRLTNLANAIAADPDPAPVVFLIVGGNDIFDNNSTDGEIAGYVGQIVSRLKTARSDVRIVFGGYDTFNLNVNPLQCNLLAITVLGSTSPAVINNRVYNVYNASASVVNGYSNAQAVNTFGALTGRAGNPDLNTFSPVEYFDDCIHLNDAGYQIYLDTVFDLALQSVLDEDVE